MRLVWITDPHLNFLHEDCYSQQRSSFFKSIKDQGDAFLITGDIAEYQSFHTILKAMYKCVKKPIYFVLGNHDFYTGSIGRGRRRARALFKTCKYGVRYLRHQAPQELVSGSRIFLVGVDGWADGRNGDYKTSPIRLNDSVYINELAKAARKNAPFGRHNKEALLKAMQKYADEDAEVLSQQLKLAYNDDRAKKIIIATHVPPFVESAVYQNKPTEKHVLPFYTSKVLGDLILKFAKTHPEIEFLVLSGHTHEYSEVRLLPNLEARVGTSKYYAPKISGILEL